MKRHIKNELLIFIFFFLIVTTSCAHSQALDENWTNENAPKVIGVWQYFGGEAPEMQMIFEKGGLLTFATGFEYLNPASWDYNPHTVELRIIITEHAESSIYSTIDSHIKAAEEMKQKYGIDSTEYSNPHYINRMGDNKIQIRYPLMNKELGINFANWIFYKKQQ